MNLRDIPLPDNWSRRAHLGLTASTGQLADNHDVVSLSTYSESNQEFVDVLEQTAATKRFFNTAPELSIEDRLLK